MSTPRDAISLGCSDYILKPAPYEVIAERVKKVCAGLQRRLREQELVKYGSRELSGPEEGMEPGKAAAPQRRSSGRRRSTFSSISRTASFWYRVLRRRCFK
ncbi:MAG: hypothetical protein ACLR2E_11930 [Lachnospiraceae bacterium]